MSNRTAPLALALMMIGTASAGAREVVRYTAEVQPGTIVVKPAERKLYLVLGGGEAIRYTVAVGRPGKQWQGKAQVSGKYVQPAWTPPAEVAAWLVGQLSSLALRTGLAIARDVVLEAETAGEALVTFAEGPKRRPKVSCPGSAQAQEGQNGENHDHQANDVDNAVHHDLPIFRSGSKAAERRFCCFNSEFQPTQRR